MANLLQDAASWLADQHHDYVSVSITYWRGSNSATLSATLGKHFFKTTDRQGNTKVERTERDFTIRAAEVLAFLSPIGPKSEPIPGDFIDLSLDGVTTERFETMSLDGRGACFDYCDDYKKRMRIHTKSKGIAPVLIVDVDGVDALDVSSDLVASV